jgi:hypothetical protein
MGRLRRGEGVARFKLIWRVFAQQCLDGEFLSRQEFYIIDPVTHTGLVCAALAMSFERTIDVSVQARSWSTAPRNFAHRFPNELGGLGGHDIHLPLMLLRLGMATTPLVNLALFTSPFWPVLRYLHVFSDDSDLRLLEDWREVDFHQKTLASDDFGVAAGLDILFTRFSYSSYADGMSFLRLARQADILENANASVPKRGPQKTPDFVFLTTTGRLHFVECKGSQSGTAALRRAMAGGVAQKRSIAFRSSSLERNLVDQRLVVGLFAARQSMRQRSVLLIADPPPDGPFFISRSASAEEVLDQVRRAHLIRILLAAGMIETARVILDFGLLPRSRSGWPDRLRRATATDRERVSPLAGGEGRWRGRRIELDLPVPVAFDDRVYTRVQLQYGIDEGIIDILNEPSGSSSTLISQRFPGLVERFGRAEAIGRGAAADITDPGLHIARLKLLRLDQALAVG